MSIKPGYKTSEFWFTLVSFIFSGLYLTGILAENDQKEELITIVTHAVESCILIGGQLVILYKYVNGRSKIKEKYQEKGTDNNGNQSPNPTRTKPASKSDTPAGKSRSNSGRSRSTDTKRKKQPSRSKKNNSK